MKNPNPLSRYASPQVLIALLAFMAAVLFSINMQRDAASPPVLLQETAEERTVERRSVVLYVVQGDLVQPIARDVQSTAEDEASDLQALVDALRLELIDMGVWPEALGTPKLYLVELDRRTQTVLDLPGDAVPNLSIENEATIVASLERTLRETGVERIAYLRAGEPSSAWLGRISTNATLQ